eukprot:CAMPEP_0197039498 /NCGR_PEP_ID=MMETSP1384-20130603/16278_1 /TAXON_ID=29189 /ORGANISM="Ammonia sp." /LENGTH=244 /DNA_ID=CAMNT_0042470105 /DNA_START=54 /DNA_END=788 /DNA_ORIENTATION=-
MASLRSQSTLPSTITNNNAMQPAPPNQMNYLDDTSSIAMFTAVGHVGLHLVVRPLMRWGIRSFLLRAKPYTDSESSDSNVSKQSLGLESESQIETELEEGNGDGNGNKKKNKNKSSKKKSTIKTLSEINTGIAGPYSEVVFTFGTLAGFSYTVHPQNILLCFGITYPSIPFILRFVHSLNDRKSRFTLSRTARLATKSLIVTGGFGVSMALVGVLLQSVPFFNIFCLAFWDCFADFILSDGPNK